MNELKRQKIKSIVEQTVEPAPSRWRWRWRYIAAGLTALLTAIGVIALLQ